VFLIEGNPFTNEICFHCEKPLFEWLMLFDLPSFLIIEFIAIPMQLLFEKNLFTEILFGFVLFFLVVFQWFSIGFLINQLIKMSCSKEIKLSLK
jgi:hypothetical protein